MDILILSEQFGLVLNEWNAFVHACKRVYMLWLWFICMKAVGFMIASQVISRAFSMGHVLRTPVYAIFNNKEEQQPAHVLSFSSIVMSRYWVV